MLKFLSLIFFNKGALPNSKSTTDIYLFYYNYIKKTSFFIKSKLLDSMILYDKRYMLAKEKETCIYINIFFGGLLNKLNSL